VSRAEISDTEISQFHLYLVHLHEPTTHDFLIACFSVLLNSSLIICADYVLEGSEGTPFEGGVYHGKIKFPEEYPFKPPGISMITPNGRFATNKKICMSMSDCTYLTVL
jgi:ubiquitin-protein ligase